MARTEITVIPMSRFTLISTTLYPLVVADIVNGNFSANDGYTWFEFTNASGASRTVTVTIPGGVDVNLAAPTRVFTLAVNGTYQSGVFPIAVYGAQLLYLASAAGVSFRVFSARGGV